MSENVFTRDVEALERADLLHLASQPEGRRFLWSLIERTGAWSPSYDTDANVTAYREGRRSIGLDLSEALKQVVPRQYLLMVQEAAQRAVEAIAAAEADAKREAEGRQ